MQRWLQAEEAALTLNGGVAPPLRRACHTPGHAPTRHVTNINVTGATSQAFQVRFFLSGLVGTCPDKPTGSTTLQCKKTGGDRPLGGRRETRLSAKLQRSLRTALRTALRVGIAATRGLVTAPSDALETLAAYFASTPLVVYGLGAFHARLRAASSFAGTTKVSSRLRASMVMRSPFRTSASGPPNAASGETCPTTKPCGCALTPTPRH